MHREGNARMTIFAASSDARTFDYQGGDVGYVPAGFGTSLELTIQQYLRSAYLFLL
jgi:oxalate decarboxylase/phosphoglucose isomerase-like protein (cupin superfamily)